MIGKQVLDHFEEIQGELSKNKRYLNMTQERLERALCWSNKDVVRREIGHAKRMIGRYDKLMSTYVLWRMEEGYFLDEATTQCTRQSCERTIESLNDIIKAAEHAMRCADKRS